MLRHVVGLVFAIHILGPIWSLICAILLIAGGVGLLHLAWQIILVATMP